MSPGGSHHLSHHLSRRLAIIALVLLGGVLIAGWAYQRELRRIWFVLHVFDGSEQAEHFRHMDQIFPVRVFHRSGPESVLPIGPALNMPSSYVFDGQSKSTTKLLEDTDTTGLLVMRNGQIVHEHYGRGNDASSHAMSWSVGKSVVSLLVGLAVQDGLIQSIDDPLTRYAPELAGTAYEGVSLKQALQMSSGVRWSEDYSNSDSDVMRFGRTFALGGSLVNFARTLPREHAPGTFNRYNSLDVQVLGLALRHATGLPLATYLEKRLWSRMGMSADGDWLLDDTGTEFAAGGINVTLRDYARIGQLCLQNGRWQGEQLVPAAWIAASHHPDAPHLLPGARANADSPFGYGYLWWVPEAVDGPYTAMGVYNQFIYIDPAHQVVIAKTSANHRYGTTNDETSFREAETLALFKAITSALDLQSSSKAD
ncbi:MAG: serine hydrolase domain-containing protein [Leptothrix ochracea]|uniref:serine hydrolase domain-containing protein n=1 Tax=Leptothrix ochracea TaxID=735331 RepID=UPI0034E20044